MFFIMNWCIQWSKTVYLKKTTSKLIIVSLANWHFYYLRVITNKKPEWVCQPSWGFLLRTPELSAVTICSQSSVFSSLSCLQFLLILCRYIPSPIWILVHLLIKFKKIVNRYSFRSTVNCLSIYYYKLIWVIK